MGARFAVVHGRFQPFHAGHLEYCRLARDRGDQLVVGITNFDPALVHPEPASPTRHTRAANPFAYWERALMIRDAFLRDGVPAERFLLVALPIHHPERWPHYVPGTPADAVHLIRVFSPWEEEKVARLETAGLRVEAIRGVAKRVSASEVRARLAADDGWEVLVPPGAREWLTRLEAPRRIRDLAGRV
jgi:nicotinamide-nucleotide adenylyltransferase